MIDLIGTQMANGSLFGLKSGAMLATVVGVLVEVPVMLSVCSFCNRTRHWFDFAALKISNKSNE